MVCKYCQAELEDGSTVCPVCGQSLEETEQELLVEAAEEVDQEAAEKNEKKEKLMFRVTAILACVVLVFALVAGVWSAVAGPLRKNELMGNASYTVSDAVAIRNGDVVVATAGGAKLTNSMLQLIYWDQAIDFVNRYYSYLSYLGLDYTQPFDAQMSGENNATWEQYFLSTALDTWHRYQALALEAEKNNYEMPADMQDFLAGIKDGLTETAVKNGFADADALAQEDYGAGVTCQTYEEYLRLYYSAISYFDEIFEKLEVTEAELEAYYTEHGASLQSQYGVNKESGKLIDVRHILIMPEGGIKDEAGNVTYSETEWENCRKKAQALLDEYLAGETTENAFSQLSLQHNQDPGSQSNGGLYEKVVVNQMVPEFNDWCFDESRQPGDTGLVKTSYGYHVMYFVYGNEGWIRYCEEGVRSEKGSEMLAEILKAHPLTVDYKKIGIASNQLG